MTAGGAKRARPTQDVARAAGAARRSDARLAAEAAASRVDAFRALYRRHGAPAWGLASAIAADPHDAAEAVAQAFAEVLSTGGPATGSPRTRTRILAATRAAAVQRHRRAGGAPAPPDLEALRVPPRLRRSGEDAGDYDDEAMAAAFRALPERWRSVLWLTAVQGTAPERAAPVLGVDAGAAAQLAVRARAGLRERFVQAQLERALPPACRACVGRLVGHLSGALPRRERSAVDLHLVECAACADRAGDLADLGSSLRRVSLPLPLAVAPHAEHRWRLARQAAAATGVAAPAGPARPPAVSAPFAGAAAPGRAAVGHRLAPAAVVPAHRRDRAAAGALPRSAVPRPALTTARLSGAQRPLAAASTGLFALGVIAASVVSSPGDRPRSAVRRAPVAPVDAQPPLEVDAPGPVRAGGPASADDAALEELARAPGTGSERAGGPPAGGAAGPTIVELPAGLRPSRRAAPAPPPAAAPAPLAQASGTLQVAGLPVGAAAGVGDANCTGVQAGGLTVGCTPPPPSGPGISLDGGGALADLVPDQSLVLPF